MACKNFVRIMIEFVMEMFEKRRKEGKKSAWEDWVEKQREPCYTRWVPNLAPAPVAQQDRAAASYREPTVFAFTRGPDTSKRCMHP